MEFQHKHLHPSRYDPPTTSVPMLPHGYTAQLYLLEGKSHSETSSLLGGGFKNEMSTRKAEKTKLENIQTLINLCFEADKNIKQGKIAGWTALETIIAEYKYY